MNIKLVRKGRVSEIREDGWIQHYCFECDAPLTDPRWQTVRPEDDQLLPCNRCDLRYREAERRSRWRLD